MLAVNAGSKRMGRWCWGVRNAFCPGVYRDPTCSPSETSGGMASRVREAGGFTFVPSQRKYRELGQGGYSVSPYPERSETYRRVSKDSIKKFIRDNGDLLSKPGHAVGAWRDPKSGKVFLDVTIVTRSRDEAVRLGRKHDQIAVFDFKRGRTIGTGGGGGEAVDNAARRGRHGRGDRTGGGFSQRGLNPLRVDPSRTFGIRRRFVADIKRRLAALKKDIKKFLFDDDELGVVAGWRQKRDSLAMNAFCPTGPGGGVDPTCSPSERSAGIEPTTKMERINAAKVSLLGEAVALRPGKSLVVLQNADEASPAKQLVVHPSARGEGKFQLTRFDADGEPIGHDTFASKSDAIASATGNRPSDGSAPYGGREWELVREATDFTTPEKVAAVWRSEKYRILASEETSPVAAGEQAASKVLKEFRDKKFVFMDEIDRRAKGGIPISDKESDLYDALQETSIVRDLEKLSGSRTLASNAVTNAQTFRFASTPAKLAAFREWLARQMKLQGLLFEHGTAEDEWWRRYIDETYKKGRGRAFEDVMRKRIKPGLTKERLDWYKGSKEDFLRSSFNRPAAIEKVKVIAGRTYESLKGFTDEMAMKTRRILTDGMIDGEHPKVLAKKLAEQLDISESRAETIARSETIHAHAEGQLDSMEALGVTEVGVSVEWSTARDDAVCPKCQPLEGIVLKVEEAHGLLPRHPNCFFSPRTTIRVKGGKKQISNIVVGDLVLTHKGRYKQVTQVHVTETPSNCAGVILRMARFVPEDNNRSSPYGPLFLTFEHPVMQVTGTWVPAGEVNPGDVLVVLQEGSANRFAAVEVSTVRHKIIKKKRLYNLSVDDDESYIAGNCVVHNCRCAFVPAGLGEDDANQKWKLDDVERAIRESLEEGDPKDAWPGAELELDPDRPKPVVEAEQRKGTGARGAGFQEWLEEQYPFNEPGRDATAVAGAGDVPGTFWYDKWLREGGVANWLVAFDAAMAVLNAGDDCGIGPGGFEEGNTCAEGEGSLSRADMEKVSNWREHLWNRGAVTKLARKTVSGGELEYLHPGAIKVYRGRPPGSKPASAVKGLSYTKSREVARRWAEGGKIESLRLAKDIPALDINKALKGISSKSDHEQEVFVVANVDNAFCPGAGAEDNSCPPANRGSSAEDVLAAKSGDRDAMAGLKRLTAGKGLVGTSLSERHKLATERFLSKQPVDPSPVHRKIEVNLDSFFAEHIDGQGPLRPIKVRSFASWTRDESRAAYYGEGRGEPVFLSMTDGSKAGMRDISKWSVYPQEQESMSPRSLELKIVEKDYRQGSGWHLKVEPVVPVDNAAAMAAINAGDNCGIGPEGFEPGNTCAKGGGSRRKIKGLRTERREVTLADLRRGSDTEGLNVPSLNPASDTGQIIWSGGKRGDVLDGFHRTAGMLKWAEENGVSPNDIKISVLVPSGDSKTIAKASDKFAGGHEEAVRAVLDSPIINAFCPTGEGGGVDPTCSPAGSSAEDVTAAKAGDRAAMARVVEQNQGLVRQLARKNARGDRQLRDDLISEGNLGLMRAVEKFDPEKGAKFVTYAHQWINGVQRNEVARQGKEKQKEGRELKVEPAQAEHPTHEADEARVEVGRALESLDARSADILSASFGVGGGEPQTHRQIAERLGITPARVGQLQKAALERLRELQPVAANLLVNVFCPGEYRDPTCSPRETSTAKGEKLHGMVRDEETKAWKTLDGKPVPEHIRDLGVPPGWKDAYFNPDPNGDLLAQGTDAKGRTQPKYGDTHNARAAAAKFGRVSELRTKREQIFKEVERDSKDPALRENADALKVVMQTGIRPGSTQDTGADFKSFGATTLEGRHVVVDGNKTALKFVTGKNKGKAVEFQIKDRSTAKMLRDRAEKAGATGKLFDTDAQRLRDYSKDKDGKGFKTKDHRTALGTETAIREISTRAELPKTFKEYKQAVKEVAMVVSQMLGNTPSVALKSYIDPTVFAKWKRPEFETAKKGKR